MYTVLNNFSLLNLSVAGYTEGKSACAWLDCKYIEVSASLNHRVDELLVGIVRQIRLNKKRNEQALHQMAGYHTNDDRGEGRNCAKGAKDLLREFFRTDVCVPPTSNCENLFILWTTSDSTHACTSLVLWVWNEWVITALNLNLV